VDLSNWYVSNQRRALQKYQFTNVTLQPDGYLVLYQNQLSTSLDPIRRIQLDAINGDQVYLSTAGANNGPLSGYRTSESFGPAEPGVSFGRYLNSQGEEQFVAMSQHTFGVDNPDGVGSFRLGTGLPNAYPLVGPVVLSEIMYHPADLGGLDNVRDEFIELFNITGSTVPLYDPLYPTNTWHVRGGVTFDFPTDVSLAADEFLLVVSFDPNTDATSLAGFRAAYNVSPSVRLYGPYGGKLDNGGEEIHLNKPGAPVSAGQINSGQVPYILVDSVKYNDKAPWPVGADGTGLSLQRFSPTGYGNDPTNWLAGAPSPGLSDSQDRDGDGIPDSWEIANGLNPDDPADANLDPDGDGLTNLQEYQLNTNPHDANSGLRITSTALANGTNMVISFMTLSNYVFTIEYCDSLGLGPWLPLQVVDAAPTNRLVQITVATTAPARFYRLRMSSQAQTAFRIKSIRPLAGSQITLAFDALANQSCALEYTTNLATGPWTTVTNFPAAATNRLIEVVRSASGPSGFYRLRSPADAQASLRFDSIQPLAGGQIALNFGASANQSCTLEYSTNLASSAWTAVTNFPAVATNRSIQVVRPTSGSGGFYRLRSP